MPPTPSAASGSTCARPAGRGTASPWSRAARARPAASHDRDYLSYLSRAEELTAVRLLCLHNLTYMHALLAGARVAILAGEFDSYRAGILAGASPFK